jgi:hypothetical protein
MEQIMQEAVIKGASGKLYRFAALRPDATFPEGPAVYAFARQSPLGARAWTPLFLSRTGNLALRVAQHERWDEARMFGATHILVLSFPDRMSRQEAEADLVEAVRPIMNEDVEPLKVEDDPVGTGQIVHFFPPIRIRNAQVA